MSETSNNIRGMELLKFLNRVRFGKCTIPEGEKLVLTVATKELDAANVTEEDIQWLEQQLEVAYYSQDNVKTTDASVRNSKYTKAFNLNFDVNKIIKNMEITGFSKPYKLNLYKKGCFFTTHRDTNRPGLLGTLVLILPTQYTGGQLCFEGINLESFGLEQEGPQSAKRLKTENNTLRFIYFDTDLEHSVSEVTSGFRISLVYNVFDNEKSAGECNTIVELAPIPKDWFDMLVQNAIDFCTGKKNILLGRFKYRNDVYQKFIRALKEKFEIINVAVSEFEMDDNLEEIEEVHLVDEQGVDERDLDDTRTFDDYVVESYKVRHVLFSSDCKMDEDKFKYYEGYGCRGNSPYFRDSELPYFTGSLINPSNEN